MSRYRIEFTFKMLVNLLMVVINKLTIAILLAAVLSFIQTSKPLRKQEQAAWRVECELGVISDPDCPVDGGWTAWEPWSTCHGACDDVGHQRRARQCVNPPPSADGLPCTGSDEEIRTCYLTNCTTEDYRRLIEGDSARIEALRQLEAVPALMDRCLKIECRYEAIDTALKSDNTWQLDTEVLWNALQCVKHNLGCPVNGEWGSWGPWSSCGARCGKGLRWRLRRCDTPPPSDDRLFCPGTPLQAEECEGDQCALDLIDLSENGGLWSPWGQWTPCSEKCGAGVRRRRRTCLEKSIPRWIGSWGTHCIGQHDEFEVCESDTCILDGDWSGWGSWGPCSQICGAGKKSRTRSCTRPLPAGGGKSCEGPKTEYAACYLRPCEAFNHVVVLFNGDSYIQYNFEKKLSTLFHFYTRFMPLSPHGTLVRRGTVHGPHVRLSMQKWHLCLDASGASSSCSIPRICSPSIIEPAVWHSALITVTSEAATLRLDDAFLPLKASFPCDPELIDDKINIIVGERIHGEIQEIMLNFIPLEITIERNKRFARSAFVPSTASNVVFEKASLKEAYLFLDNDHYMRLPCFDAQDEWRLELTLKSKRESGTILFLRDDVSESWLHMSLQNKRLKLKAACEDFRTESSSSKEYPPNEWLDVTLLKKKVSNTIEASINGGERLHVVLDETARKRRGLLTNKLSEKKTGPNAIANSTSYRAAPKTGLKSTTLAICSDEFFVGGFPADTGVSIDESTPFSGVIASVSIDNILQNIHDLSVERYKDYKVQVSSRTASISGSYHEAVWGTSNRLNLTCLHARTARSPQTAHWLYLDTTVQDVLRDKTVRSVDDGRVLRLVASADNDLRGFYTCRAHNNKRTRNIVTYGVIGRTNYNLSGPDTTTALAVISTVLLVLVTLGWLVLEGFYDLRNGFGFFRDAHFTPEEEAEAVCQYIDENMHLIGSKSCAMLAKDRARRRGHELALASRSSFAAQEPQGLMQFENYPIEEFEPEQASDSTSEPEDLPALPEKKPVTKVASKENTSRQITHDVYRCETSYISSPRHGSRTSPRSKLSSSSSVDLVSPRLLCNRLLLSRKMNASKDNLWSRKNKSFSKHFESPRKRSNLLTIKSSGVINLSPGQKILQKFQQLKCDV